MAALLGQIYYKDKVHIGTEYIVDIDMFSELYGLVRETAYRALRDIAMNLLSKRVSFPSATEEDVLVSTNWITVVKEKTTCEQLTVTIPEELIPYVAMLEAHFTSYNVEYIAKLQGVHSYRLYEILKSKTNKYSKYRFEVTLDEFRNLLSLEGKYEQFNLIKRRILEVSIPEINLHTDIMVEVIERKLGRKVTSLVFKLEKKW
jgi:plasmid replication initiation protein